MVTPRWAHVLLASHGTPGARAAESAALDLCEAGGRLSHLVIVPDLWRGMMGDDWLNNAATRDVYGRYVESELKREIEANIDRLRAAAASRGLRYVPRVVLGKPAPCLVEFCREVEPSLVVMGSPRPKGVAGLRSRLHVEDVVGRVTAPLFVVPHP